ncbi:MAG: HAD hydrolase family protein [Gammaproteobacteria bacterium]|nr:HAD hydrolase family protein [Gammaproteobacteria bacterium]
MEIQALNKAAASIQMVVFDVDGVFTDGRIWINHLGEETKSFHVRDGHGVRMLIHYGVHVAVLSGRESKAVDVRMKELGITDVLQGQIDKRTAFTELTNKNDLPVEQVAFVGDDIIDVPAMQLAGLSFAVADAHQWVKSHADHITEKTGGHGAVREVCELILDSKGLLTEALNYNVTQ